MKFKRRHGEFEQGCVLSESYTATDTLPPILPACRQLLLPTCVFITRDTVRHPRRFLFGKFVRKPICSWWKAFMNRCSTVIPTLGQGWLKNIILCSPKCPDQICSPPSLTLSGYHGSFPRPRVVVTFLHLLTQLRLHVAILSIQHIFIRLAVK
jgi:hypothetical protein